MLEEVSSPDHSDQELNYRQFMELHKETKTKRVRNARSSKELEQLHQEKMKLWIDGDFAKCKQKVMEMITLDPKNSASYFMMGEIYEAENDKLKAAHYYSLSIQLSAPDPRLWEKIGDLYSSIEFYQQSAYCYGRCLKSEPFNSQVLLKRAKAYENQEESRKALFMYYKLLKIRPDLQIIKRATKLHYKLGQFDKARELLRQVPLKDQNITYMICETLMKEKKYQELIHQINQVVLEGGKLSYDTLLPEFLKMLIIAGYALKIPDTDKHLNNIIQQTDQTMVSLLEGLVEQLNLLGRKQQSSLILFGIVSNANVPHKPDHYLKLAEYYSSVNDISKTNQILQRGCAEFPENRNIRSQLGFLKIKIGDLEKGVRMVQQNKEESEEEVFMSDLSENEQAIKVSKVMKPSQITQETKVEKNKKRDKNKQKQKTRQRVRQKKRQKSEDENSDEEYVPCQTEIEEDEFKNNIEKRISHLHETVELKKDDPHVLLQFYTNINSLLKDVIIFYSKLKQEMYQETYVEEKRGLFAKKIKHKKRKARLQQKQGINEQSLVMMLHTWITNVFRISCWYKIFSLSTTISRLVVLKKYPQQRKRIYQLCVLACLHFKRYRRAFFLLRYLLSQDPNNIFYVLLCNVLLRKIKQPKTGKFVLAKLAQQQNKYPNLSYLIAFEHLQSGYFEHSIKSLLKIPVNEFNQENIMLCFVSCFIQIASSRNTTDKLLVVNRATYMLNEYRKVVEKKNSKSFELFYNLGRFYHQLKLSSKAISCYEKAIEIASEIGNKTANQRKMMVQNQSDDQDSDHNQNQNHRCKQHLSKAVYSLLFLYKELQYNEKYIALSKQYFSI